MLLHLHKNGYSVFKHATRRNNTTGTSSHNCCFSFVHNHFTHSLKSCSVRNRPVSYRTNDRTRGNVLWTRAKSYTYYTISLVLLAYLLEFLLVSASPTLKLVDDIFCEQQYFYTRTNLMPRTLSTKQTTNPRWAVNAQVESDTRNAIGWTWKIPMTSLKSLSHERTNNSFNNWMKTLKIYTSLI
jgi:hypothetical protein